MRADSPIGPTSRTTGRLVAPTPFVACLVFVAYVLLVNGIQFASGIPYAEFFRSADSTLRSAVASLAAGALLLLAFVTWAGWDHVWRDPMRLPMTPLMWVAPVVMVTLMIARLALKLSAGVPLDLAGAMLLAGIGVGFSEELLFRGIVLRSLRTGGRTEAQAMLFASLWFGAMHLSNAFVGSPLWLSGVQAAIAAVQGMTLYQFRRGTGLIVTGMIVHGLWDISTFLPAVEWPLMPLLELGALIVVVLVGLVSGGAVLSHDRAARA